MTKEEIISFRNLLQGQLIRTYNLSLSLHKEQERIEDLIRILDTYILREVL